MKKVLTGLILGLGTLALAGTALAASSQNTQIQKQPASNQTQDCPPPPKDMDNKDRPRPPKDAQVMMWV